MEKICGIYCIENLVNGKKYVGQSVDINSRLRHHKNDLRKNKHKNQRLQNSWNLHGEENFKFYILEQCDEKLLDEIEIKYISEWDLQDSQFGYNIESGGNLHKHAGEETKQKMRCRYISEETKKKMSASAKLRCLDPNWKIQQSNKIKGRKASDETKLKLSISHTGQKRSEEFKEKQRNAQIGSQVMCIETGEIFECAKDAGILMGLGNTSSGAILECCREKRKSRGGYHWKFADNIQKSDASNESVQ